LSSRSERFHIWLANSSGLLLSSSTSLLIIGPFSEKTAAAVCVAEAPSSELERETAARFSRTVSHVGAAISAEFASRKAFLNDRNKVLDCFFNVALLLHCRPEKAGGQLGSGPFGEDSFFVFLEKAADGGELESAH